jgi:hypothetical protein
MYFPILAVLELLQTKLFGGSLRRGKPVSAAL